MKNCCLVLVLLLTMGAVQAVEQPLLSLDYQLSQIEWDETGGDTFETVLFEMPISAYGLLHRGIYAVEVDDALPDVRVVCTELTALKLYHLSELDMCDMVIDAFACYGIAVATDYLAGTLVISPKQ